MSIAFYQWKLIISYCYHIFLIHRLENLRLSTDNHFYSYICSVELYKIQHQIPMLCLCMELDSKRFSVVNVNRVSTLILRRISDIKE